MPNRRSNNVSVIDPATLKVVDRFPVGIHPQHVIPSWDLKTLWVTNNAEGRTDGSLTPIDPTTGKPGESIAVDDPYNMYFTPDGRFAIFTCEFEGSLVKIDFVNREVLGYLKLSKDRMPQDIRISPDGKVFFVVDLRAGGVFLIDGDQFTEIGFIKTGIGAHGLYPSRDTTKRYVANRGASRVYGPPGGKGSVSVIDFETHKVVATWDFPKGGSPDMGNVSADGKILWLSGRFDDVVYAIDTTTGKIKTVRVGTEPHGLTVWPQPGRYSLGHTGNLR